MYINIIIYQLLVSFHLRFCHKKNEMKYNRINYIDLTKNYKEKSRRKDRIR